MSEATTNTSYGNLATALCAVMMKTGYVQKTGRNQFHRYTYASDADLLAAIQPAMAENGLALLPTGSSVTTTEHSPDRKGKTQWRTDVHLRYRLIHGPSGEWMDLEASGCGIDGEDKGLYKAKTGALKYLLRHLFLVPTGDDPEVDTGQPPVAPQQRQQAQPSQPSQPEAPPVVPAAPAPADALSAADDYLKSKGIDPEAARWFSATQSRDCIPMEQRDQDSLRGFCRYLTSDEGRKLLKQAVDQQSKLRATFFRLWDQFDPKTKAAQVPDKAERDALEAQRDERRRQVIRSWWEVDSLRAVHIDRLRRGNRSIGWLLGLGPDQFAEEAARALGSTS